MGFLTRHAALLQLHFGILLLGGTPLFSKLVPLPALDIISWRSLFAALALAGMFLATRASIRLRSGRDYALVVGLGVLFAVHWVTYFHAMQVATVAVGVVAMFTFPVMTVLIEPLFNRRPPSSVDLLGGCAVVLGVYLMVPAFSLEDATTQGVLWGLLSALLYALRNVIQRHHFHRYSGGTALFYQVAVVLAVTAPFLSRASWQLPATGWALLLLLGVVFTAVPHTLFANALLRHSAVSVSLINCLQVVYATVFAALVLSELPGSRTIIGGALIVGAAAFESVRSARK
ncbi:DMT family transporter [Aquisalimonas lutea]|uniref:DMT family transporter n=1 Tax=Aquisalimonas lutea TaxID=1327750 RepID=UPI0025B41F69|nr:DMT family transporter [Aquisalimonas lutea]MDN3517936.1 DMT family transporter [Aquisalimonas lutea]